MLTPALKDIRKMPQVALRMVQARNLAPLTRVVKAGLRKISRKGAELVLDRAIIDGQHVVMDVQNILPKLAQVGPWDQPELERGLLGRIVCYHSHGSPQETRFVLELAWTSDRGFDMGSLRDLMRLCRTPQREETA